MISKDDLLQKIKGINIIHLTWVVVLVSLLFTTAISAALHGRFLVEYFLVGGGVALLNVLVFVLLVRQVNARERETAATLKAFADNEAYALKLQSEIREKTRIQQALQESELRYALAARGAKDGLWDWDIREDRIFYSNRWKEMLGFREDEILTKPAEWMDRVHPDDLEQLQVALYAHLDGLASHFENEHRILHKDGSWRWVLTRGLAVRDTENKAVRIAGSQTDITAWKRTEAQLVHDAFHDALTGLPNRALFIDRLGRTLARSKRRAENNYAVLFLDIDRFKLINESFGHEVGDDLLVAIARRLEGCLRLADTVAHVSGDEFAILLDDVETELDAIRTVERIQETVRAPFNLHSQEVFISASIGIVKGSHAYERAEDALRDADIAMFQAKAQGKNSYILFEEGMRIQATTILHMETDLHRAVLFEDFRLHYQPILDFASGRIIGLEGLVRWVHPEKGLVSPGNFIPLAEETGLINSIGSWVFREACLQTRIWQERYPMDPPLSVSINVSSKQFAKPTLLKEIEDVLQKTGLDARSLKLEITETSLMENLDHMRVVLHDLEEMGIEVHIDDFGTGYSSLNYLHHLPIAAIKIDRSFIARIGVTGNEAEIVRTILALAKDLDVAVIAEGVETIAQAARLRELDCPYVQGHLFSRTVPANKVEKMLQEPPWMAEVSAILDLVPVHVVDRR